MTANPLALYSCDCCGKPRPCIVTISTDIYGDVSPCHECRHISPWTGRYDGTPCEACEEWNLEGAVVLMGPMEEAR